MIWEPPILGNFRNPEFYHIWLVLSSQRKHKSSLRIILYTYIIRYIYILYIYIYYIYVYYCVLILLTQFLSYFILSP